MTVGTVTSPSDMEDRYGSALREVEKGNLDAGLKIYHSMISGGDIQDAAMISRIVNDIGAIAWARGDASEARLLFEQAIGLDGFNQDAATNLQRIGEILGRRMPVSTITGYLTGFFPDQASADSYVSVHKERFSEMLAAIGTEGNGARMLELGSNTFFSLLLRRFTGYDVHHSDMWEGKETERRFLAHNQATSEIVEFTILNFNAEKDRYPFEDRSFDVVLAAEIIEHLPNDPMFMLSESNRILKEGGRLVLTTPNITSHRSLAALLNGYSPFLYNKFTKSGGRHCIEYAPREIRLMMERAGFHVESLETKNVWMELEDGQAYRDIYRSMHGILIKLGSPTNLRGEDIFAVGRKNSAVVDRFPPELYD